MKPWRALLACLGTVLVSAAWVFGPLACAHFAGPAGARVLVLSFDDGPYPPYTDALLDVLDAEHVHATFFVTGSQLAAHRELGERMLRAGHALASHSWDGALLVLQPPTAIRRRIEKTDAVLREVGWTGPIDFRAPHGMEGPATLWWLWHTGHRQVLGTAIGDGLRPGRPNGDCLLPPGLVCATQDPRVLETRTLAAARPGAILVLHDGYDGGPGADRSGSVEAVRRAIPELRARGYRFVTVPELLDGAR